MEFHFLASDNNHSYDSLPNKNNLEVPCSSFLTKFIPNLYCTHIDERKVRSTFTSRIMKNDGFTESWHYICCICCVLLQKKFQTSSKFSVIFIKSYFDFNTNFWSANAIRNLAVHPDRILIFFSWFKNTCLSNQTLYFLLETWKFVIFEEIRKWLIKHFFPIRCSEDWSIWEIILIPILGNTTKIVWKWRLQQKSKFCINFVALLRMELPKHKNMLLVCESSVAEFMTNFLETWEGCILKGYLQSFFEASIPKTDFNRFLKSCKNMTFF